MLSNSVPQCLHNYQIPHVGGTRGALLTEVEDGSGIHMGTRSRVYTQTFLRALTDIWQHPKHGRQTTLHHALESGTMH